MRDELTDERLTEFIERSGQGGETSVLGLRAEIAEYEREGVVCRILGEDGSWKGIFWAKVMPTVRGELILNVGGMFAWGRLSRREVEAIDEALGKYAKGKGAGRIGFYTKRGGEAFRRWCGGTWEVDSVLLTREV